MKKNRTILVAFLLAFSTFAYTQSNTSHTEQPIDSRLYDAFSGDYLENLKSANPFLLKRWNYYLDHSWYLTDLPSAKDPGNLASIRLESLDNLNILLVERKHGLQRNWERQTVIKLEGTDKALVLLAGKEFNEKLNEHLNR